jgi:integrase
MTTMGAHGEGGIARRKDGRLQAALTMPNGRRVYRTIPRDRDQKRQRRRADAALRELVRIREADLDPAGQTLADYLRSWLRDMASTTHARVRPNTIAYYRNAVDLHIIPVLGTHRLDLLRPRHVQAWLDGVRLAPRTVAHLHATLRRALNVAVRHEIIDRNPAQYIELPKVPEFQGAPLTTAEARRLIETSAGDRLGVLWRLAIVTGLRIGELLALSWDDLVDDRLTVTGQLARLDGQWVRVPTKAARTIATIALGTGTVAALAEHRRRQAAARTPDWKFWGLMFTTASGLPLHRVTALAEFRIACDRAGISRRRVHDLRATSATLLADLGVTEDVRQARLGHSTKAMARHYAAASERQDRDAVERLEESLA